MAKDATAAPGQFTIDWSPLTNNITAVALQLPTFWTQNVDAWFVKVEAQMRNANITVESTKFDKVLAVLPESAAVQVRDITSKATYEAGDYELLKTRLIKQNQPSTLERLDRLCEMKNVNKKPSDVLLEIEAIFHSATSDHKMPMNTYFKKFWWLRAMPASIQQAFLPVADTVNLSELVIIANQMYAANPPVASIAAVESTHTSSDTDDVNGQTVAIVNKRHNPRQKKDAPAQPLFCKYHAKFGDQAKRCVPGCSKHSQVQGN